MNKLDLEITQKHLDAAIRETTGWCAVCLAIMEQIPGAKFAQVSVDGMRFTVGDQRYLFPPTPELHAYLPVWDAGGTPKPFRIHSENPQVVTQKPRGQSSPRVGELRATKPALSPRNRRFGEKVLRVNRGTVDDDLAEYDRIRDRSKARVSAGKAQA
jgi:hypothetical protein